MVSTRTDPSEPKQTRVPLTPGDQADVARHLFLRTDAAHLMRTYNVSRYAILNIRKERDEILICVTENKSFTTNKDSISMYEFFSGD